MPRLDCRPCLLLLISTCAIAAAQNDSLEVGPHAQALHDSALVVDTHADTPQRFLERGFDIGSADPHAKGDINDPKVQHHNGLTDFGKQVVLEMNRLGMMVDISHVADKTFWDAIAVSKAPVIASHSSARALTSAPRNMTDDMLRAVAKNNGVVMVNFYAGFVDEDFLKAEAAQSKAREGAVQEALAKQKAEGKKPEYMDVEPIEERWLGRIPRPPLKSLIDHIDHIAKVAGIDHVGLGSDFDGVSGALPQGINSAADLPKITQALVDRGYKDEDIRKILGGNLLRVMREVERVSQQIEETPSN